LICKKASIGIELKSKLHHPSHTLLMRNSLESIFIIHSIYASVESAPNLQCHQASVSLLSPSDFCEVSLPYLLLFSPSHLFHPNNPIIWFLSFSPPFSLPLSRSNQALPPYHLSTTPRIILTIIPTTSQSLPTLTLLMLQHSLQLVLPPWLRHHPSCQC
jgi:hypothetical protein